MSPATTWAPALDGATIRSLYPVRSAFQGDGALALEGLAALLSPRSQ